MGLWAGKTRFALCVLSGVVGCFCCAKNNIMERFPPVSVAVSLRKKSNWGCYVAGCQLKSLRVKEDRKKSLSESTIWVFSFMCSLCLQIVARTCTDKSPRGVKGELI